MTAARKPRKTSVSAQKASSLKEPNIKLSDDALDQLQNFLLDPDVVFTNSQEEAERLGVDQSKQLNDLKILLRALLPEDDFNKLVHYMQEKEHKTGVLYECFEFVSKKLNVNGE